MSQIIYSVTIKLDQSIEKEWKNWMINHHIPDVMKTGCFESYVMSTLRGDTDEHGVTYSIQYTAHSEESLNTYMQNFVTELQKEHMEKYKGRFGAFRTLLDICHKG